LKTACGGGSNFKGDRPWAVRLFLHCLDFTVSTENFKNSLGTRLVSCLKLYFKSLFFKCFEKILIKNNLFWCFSSKKKKALTLVNKNYHTLSRWMKHRGRCCFNCLSEESKAGCGPCTTNNAVGCGWWIQPPSTPVDLVWRWGRRGTHRHVIMGGDELNLPRRRYFLDSSWSTDPERRSQCFTGVGPAAWPFPFRYLDFWFPRPCSSPPWTP